MEGLGPLGPLGPLVPFAASSGDRKVPRDEWVVRVFGKENPRRWSIRGARGNGDGGVVIRSTAGSGRSPVIPEKGVPTVGEAPLTCNRGEAKISVSPWVPSLTWQASK